MELYTAVAVPDTIPIDNPTLTDALFNDANRAAHIEYGREVTKLLARTTRCYWNKPGDLRNGVIVISKWATRPAPATRRQRIWANAGMFIGGDEVLL